MSPKKKVKIKLFLYLFTFFLKKKNQKTPYFNNIIMKNALDLLHQSYFRRIFYTCIIANCVVICLFWHRQDAEMKEKINFANKIFIYIFTFHLLIRLLRCGPRFFHKWFNSYEFLIIAISYLNIYFESQSHHIEKKFTDPDFDFYRIFNAFTKGLQFSKFMFIFKKFQNLKQLSFTLKKIFPLFFSLLLFIILILYMFSILSMNLLAFLKTQSTVNGIDIHFRTFSYSLYSLVRIASSEIWFKVFSDCVRQQSPNFVCYEIKNFNDFEDYGFMGCGQANIYAFFFFFHLLFSLIIFNIFIALIISSYDNEHKALKTAVSRYQLWDIKKKWFEFDPEGLGYINYKDFWNFSSEVALIFGVADEEMKDLKSKKNFLKMLKIPIYLNKKENIFCYKFHDVIIEISKFAMALKYGVIKFYFYIYKNTNIFLLFFSLDGNIGDEIQEKYESKATKAAKKEEKFRSTEFESGDMFAILLFQKKLKDLIKRRRKNLYFFVFCT